MNPTLEEVIETCCADLRRGVTPNIEALTSQHPEYTDTLRRLLPTLLTMDDFAQEASGLPQEIELPLPMMLGREFRLVSELGQGGMGAVFEAVQLPLERRCAVKVLARHLAADPRHREAFIREARVMGSLHHPNIVKVFSAGETTEYAYYAMEFIQGKTLEHNPPLGARQLADFALQVALALAYAHQCGVTHCDIKPSNLLLENGSRLLISDFGLARLGEAHSVSLPNYTGGTRAYMAPECLETHAFTPLSDQYAFGVTFLELAKQLDSLPPDLAAILAVCTAPEASHRYRDLNDVAMDLRHFLAGEPVSVRPASRYRKLRLWMRRHPMATASALLLSIGLPFFTAMLAYSHQQTCRALEEAEHNLSVADTALACTFEHLGRNEPSRQAAVLLEVLMPYYQDILHRRNAPIERLAEADAILANMALRTGDYATATSAFQHRSELIDTPRTSNQLAEAYALAGDSDAALALYQSVSEMAAISPLEALRAQCAVLALQQTHPSPQLLERLHSLQAADPENAEIQHLTLSALALSPNCDKPALERARIQLAENHPENPAYGIAALQIMTARLESAMPLTSADETLLESARKLAQRLLGQWSDDPQILLATVQFAVADRNHQRRHPRLNLQANRAAERLSGALEVLFFGSSLPEDTRDPLFQKLFTQLIESRHQAERSQAARFRHRINERLPQSARQNTRGRKFPKRPPNPPRENSPTPANNAFYAR